MRKTKKRNYLVIALVVILLALAVGYAAFSQNLTITGTATAKGDFDVIFVTPTVTPGTNDATHNVVNTAVLSNSNHTLTVTVTLTKPGDSETVNVYVKNDSTLTAAKINGITITPDTTNSTGATLTSNSPSFTYGVIQANLNATPFATTDANLAAQATTSSPYSLTFTWDPNDTSTNVDQTFAFNITIEYTQA